MADRELLARNIPAYIDQLELEEEAAAIRRKADQDRIDQLELQKEHILDAIREHRATQTPMMWSEADKKLYQQLPEVRSKDVINHAR